MELKLAVEQEQGLRNEHDVVLAGFEFATATTGEWVVLAAELIMILAAELMVLAAVLMVLVNFSLTHQSSSTIPATAGAAGPVGLDGQQ